MEELGLEEACDLRACSKKHAETIAQSLKPLAGIILLIIPIIIPILILILISILIGARFMTLLFP